MSLNDIGGAIVPVRKLPENGRAQEIREVFASVYDKKPDYYIRVPGRVNLIGEHIDYCGYSVCPMALEQDIFMAISVEDDRSLKLHNLDSKFEDFHCHLTNFEILIGEGAPKWYQYFLCGVKGILDVLPKDTPLKGMKVAVKGRIPQSAGLSSSSALVSAASLATAYAHKIALPKEEFASLCANCERYIGTQGGGMDQAIAFLANEGCAKLIEFSPLRSTDVKLPSGSVFVIAHSLTNLNKAATAHFNCRVVECRLAAQVIAKKRNLDWTKIKRLGELQKALNLELYDMVKLTKECLHEYPYSKEELLKELQTTSDDLNSTSLTPNTEHIDSFKLRQRAMHVFQEALRVQLFNEACSQAKDHDTLATLGRLMTESHASLRDLYECSHPQLDRLVELSKERSLGTRLTGAGWGGCIVALMKEEDVEKYIELVTEQFYKPLGIMDGLDGLVFSTSPNAGACIFEE